MRKTPLVSMQPCATAGCPPPSSAGNSCQCIYDLKPSAHCAGASFCSRKTTCEAQKWDQAASQLAYALSPLCSQPSLSMVLEFFSRISCCKAAETIRAPSNIVPKQVPHVDVSLTKPATCRLSITQGFVSLTYDITTKRTYYN